jgi:hypothetical protein
MKWVLSRKAQAHPSLNSQYLHRLTISQLCSPNSAPKAPLQSNLNSNKQERSPSSVHKVPPRLSFNLNSNQQGRSPNSMLANRSNFLNLKLEHKLSLGLCNSPSSHSSPSCHSSFKCWSRTKMQITNSCSQVKRVCSSNVYPNTTS